MSRPLKSGGAYNVRQLWMDSSVRLQVMLLPPQFKFSINGTASTTSTYKL